MKATLKNFKEFLEEGGLSLGKVLRKPKSITSLVVGEIYTFIYEGQEVGVIVIATNATTTGFYLSNKGNLLITCIKLDFDIKSHFKYSTLLILRNLYKNSKEAKYPKVSRSASFIPKILSRFFSRFKEKVRQRTVMSLFGKSNFRTYNFKKISNIHELNINGIRD